MIGAWELSAGGLTTEPTITPKPRIAITATAAAEGLSVVDVRRGAGAGAGSGSAPATPSIAATCAGMSVARSPQATQYRSPGASGAAQEEHADIAAEPCAG